jgi:23S rRNA pseudouridine2605 synthase
VTGQLTTEQELKFREGVPWMAGALCPPPAAAFQQSRQPLVRSQTGGRPHNQIRMMFKHFGKLVEKLKRVRIGPSNSVR